MSNKKAKTGLIQDQKALHPGWRSGGQGKQKQTANFIGDQLYKPTSTVETPKGQNAYNQPNIISDNVIDTDMDAYNQPNIEDDNLMLSDEEVYIQPNIENDNVPNDYFDAYSQPNIENDNVISSNEDAYIQPDIEDDNLMTTNEEVYIQPDIENDNLMPSNEDAYLQPELIETTLQGDVEVYEQPTVVFDNEMVTGLDAYLQPELIKDKFEGDTKSYEQPDIQLDKYDGDKDVYKQPNPLKTEFEKNPISYKQPEIEINKFEGERDAYTQPNIQQMIDEEMAKLGNIYNEVTLKAIRRKLEHEMVYKFQQKKKKVELGNIGVTKEKEEKLEDKLYAEGYDENTIKAIDRKLQGEILYEQKSLESARKNIMVKKSLGDVTQKINVGFNLGNIYDETIITNATKNLDNQRSTSNDIEEKIKEIARKRQIGEL